MNYLHKSSYYVLIALTLFTFSCTSDTDESDVTTDKTSEETTSNTPVSNENDVIDEVVIIPDNSIDPIDIQDTLNPNNNNNTGNNNETNNMDDTPVVRVITEEEAAQLNFATFTIFNKSSRSPRTNARKWTKNITLFLSGDYGNKELNFIRDYASELAGISTNIDVSVVSTKSESNVEVYFATQEKFLRERPNFIDGYRPSSPTVRGRAQTYFNTTTNIINRGLVWIDPSAKNLQSIVKHELTHLIGLGHTDEENSIMKPAPEVDPKLSNNDVFAIHTLYNDMIKANFAESEIRNTVENNLETFFD